MDSDKDKPLLDKSLSFPSENNPEPENNNNPEPESNNDPEPESNNNPEPESNNRDNSNGSEQPDDHQDLPQSDEVNIPETPKPSSDADPNPELLPDDDSAAAVEPEIKDEQEPSEVEHEETLPPLLDLKQVSEEIDQYISTLSDSKEEESSTTLDVPIVVEHFTVLVEARVADYDSGDTPVKWSSLTEEDKVSFFESIIRLSSVSKSLSEFYTEFKNTNSANRIGGVLQRAMSYVEEEFKSLLEEHKIHDSDPSNDNETKAKQESEQNPPEESAPMEENNFPGYSDENLSDLVTLSKAMIAGGHESECCQVYFVARRNSLNESLHKLGFEKHSIDDVQKMHWESLEREIVTWIRTFKEWVEVYFPCERHLCNAIFSDHPSISESLFCSLSQGVTIQLLNFAGAVALTKRAAEKLFKFLDVYEALKNILPTIDDSSPEDWTNEVKTESSIIKGRTGEAIISIFIELENSIEADSGKTPVPGGAVHPLTRYTMNYLKLASEYKEILEHVFREHQKIERADSTTGSEFNYNSQAQNVTNEVVKQSPFQIQLIKVMDLLDANLEGKSKLYKDHSLTSIFLMNNGRYILQKVRGSSELNTLMDGSWCRKRSTDLRQYHKGYQRETWGKLLSCFHSEGLMANGKIVKPQVKERFKSFNNMFDEIHKTQSTWVVSDEQLQSELRVSISNMVIPAYRSFLGRFGQVFTPGRQTEKYVKYQPEDIETYIDELFDGSAAPMGRRRQ